MSVKPAAKRRPKADAPQTIAATDMPVGLCIAGIGASAGGYDAIRKFFRAMPEDSGVAFVVVQHLDPTHTSLAAELFAKCTSMPVSEAREGERIEANHVYTSPSDKDVAVKNGCLRLTPRPPVKQLHLPIDHFFSSLGLDCGARAIGIVLSGTGTDGTLGLKEIAAQGGIVLVQEPVSAQFDGMPNSAIAAAIANYVLPVEEMPAVIAGYVRHPYVGGPDEVDPGLIDPKTLQSLFTIVQARRGHDFSGYKPGTMFRRIQRRMGLHNILKSKDYLALLQTDPNEVDALFRDLLIGVTEFFRDPLAWDALDADVIIPLVGEKERDEPIRIWIPGCSTGEEAYTMAMVVLERLRRVRKHCPVQIFATDTNNDALEVGRLGRYPVGIAARIPASWLGRYFVGGVEQQSYTVNETLRSSVIFGVQNLFSDPPFGRVDLISCRNVLIYLESAVQKRVLNIFHFALRPKAYLFLGSAESNGGRDDMFKPLSKKWRIYRRNGVTQGGLLALPRRVGELPGGLAVTSTRVGPPLSQVAGIAQKLILDRFAPASVLINSRCETLYFCGPTDDFLLRPRGVPSQDLLAMVREGLRSRVRAALREAESSGLTVNVTGARMRGPQGFVPVRITVAPSTGDELGRLFLVVFRQDHVPVIVPADSSAEGALVRHLEEELKVTRDDLQSTIERFESANENLKVSNEEVVTSNEELRSLNEELESSKEELQSLNEELSAANQQLEGKVRELEIANNDLRNLLNSSDIATICLDRACRIKWFTPATQTQFKFMASDVGRPITDFSLAWSGGGLIDAAEAVLAGQAVPPHAFQTEDARRYLRRMLAYRSERNEISGVIVTFTDITDSQLALDAASLARQDLSESRAMNEKLRLLSVALATAEARERRKLAQDLHDDLGQLLAVIGIKAAALKKEEMPESLQKALGDCMVALDQASRKVRAMAFDLNPPMLEQLGFGPALEWLVHEIQQLYKLEVTVHDDGKAKPMDPGVSATLFRAVRELLINVAKHARVGAASVVNACGDGDTLTVTVSDAGAGFDPRFVGMGEAKGGFGLLSVRERIGLLGGSVAIQSSPGNGTRVVLKVPLLNTDGEVPQAGHAGTP